MDSFDFSKCARNVIAALAAVTGLLFSAGCGSSGNSATPNQAGFSNSNFSGTYVVSIAGTDLNTSAKTESFFAITGAITADGKGNITGGTVDINDADLGGSGVFTSQAVSANTYTVASDGRGHGTIATPQKSFAIDFVLTSNSHGLVTRVDNAGTGSGTLDLQSSATQTSLQALAFSVGGSDSSGNPLASVGAFALNSAGTITAGTEDFNDNGSSSTSGLAGSSLTGSLTLSSGTNGTAQLNSGFGALTFDVWVIDSTHLKLIETDGSGAALSGDAFTQQTSFTAGQLVYTLSGFDSTFNPLVAGGFFTATSGGALSSGLEDYNDAGTTNTLSSLSGSCTTFTAGRCQLALSGFSNGGLNNFIFAAYPSSGGILLLEIDNLGLLQGTAYPQTATSFAASAGYGLNLSGTNGDSLGNAGEVDDIAQFNVTSATNISGALDENSILGGTSLNVPLSGTYTPDSPATGRGSISATARATFIGGLTLEYYVVNSSTIIFIEGDSNQATVGTFQLQTTPSAAAAAQSHISLARPVARAHGAFKHK